MTTNQPPTIEERLSRLETLFTNVGETVLAHNAAIAAMWKNVNAQSATINVLVANIQQLTENVNAVTNRVDTLAIQAEQDRAQAAQDRSSAATVKHSKMKFSVSGNTYYNKVVTVGKDKGNKRGDAHCHSDINGDRP